MAKQRASAGRRRRTRVQWEAVVRKYHASDLSQAKFAARNGIPVGTLQYWVWKLRDEGKSRASRSRGTGVRFVEVEDASSPSPRCRVTVGRGVIVELDSLPPAAWVRELSEV